MWRGSSCGLQEDHHTKNSFLEAFPLMAKAGDTVILQGCGSCWLCEGTAVLLGTHLSSPYTMLFLQPNIPLLSCLCRHEPHSSPFAFILALCLHPCSCRRSLALSDIFRWPLDPAKSVQKVPNRNASFSLQSLRDQV